MIKIVSTLVVSVSLISILGCSNSKGCGTVNLSKEEREWFNPASKFDTIHFSSDFGGTNTFVLDTGSILDYSPCNKFELGPNVYQFGGYTYHNLDNYPVAKFRDRFSLSFSKTGQKKSDKFAEKQISFFDLSTEYFYDFKTFTPIDTLITELHKSVEVYLFSKNSNCSNKEGHSDVMAEFAISKAYGLMWYRTTDGTVYHRDWN